MAKHYRVFVAHSKSDGDDVIAACVGAFLEKYNGKGEFKMTLGRDDYQANFKKCGSWPSWIHNIVHGTPYGSNEKTFNLILVPALRVGKATADIVQEALAAGTQVVVRDDQQFKKVVGVNRVAEEWQNGWKLEAR